MTGKPAPSLSILKGASGMKRGDRYSDLKRANFKLIEKELYHYLARKAELEHERNNILNGTAFPEVCIQSGPGNSTQSKAMQLQSGVLMETARRLAAIEYGIQRLRTSPEPMRWELVKKKYFENRLTHEGIMAELCIGHDTFYRWRREFVELVAERLGWEVA
jgi:RinA family phage transcriptional activator